jgi:sugar phosphate isomerase/epimerase
MKIGVSSYSFANFIKQNNADYFTVIDKAIELGFDGIEFIDLDWMGLSSSPIQTAFKIKEYCKAKNFPIIAYTVGANLLCDNAFDEVERLKKQIDIAEILGVKVFRHDVTNKLKDLDGYTYKNAIEDMMPLIKEITLYAKEKGIKTCTENHGYIFQAPDRVKELIDAVDEKNYGWLLDIGNFLCVDKEPLSSAKIALPYTFHVHAKDFYFSLDEKENFEIKTANGNYLLGTILGKGIVPIKECVQLLKDAGYDGYISLEFEGKEDNELALKQGLNFLREIV